MQARPGANYGGTAVTKGRWWLLVKAVISVALLGFLLRQADLAQLATLLLEADVLLLALALGAIVLAWMLNTLKWQLLLHALGHHPAYGRLLALNYIGMFYSLVLPGQVGGEVLKGFRLTQAGTPAAHAAVSIGIDRLTGLIALGVLGLGGLALAPRVPASQAGLWVMAAVALLAGGVLLLVRLRPPETWNLPYHIGPFRRIYAVLSAFWQGLATFRAFPGTLILALGQAVGVQALVTLSNYLAALAVGVDIAPVALLWIVSTVSLAHVLPISFGGLGVREGAYVFLLHQYGVPIANALSLSLAIFGIILLQGMVGGMLEALLPKLKLASLEQRRI